MKVAVISVTTTEYKDPVASLELAAMEITIVINVLSENISLVYFSEILNICGAEFQSPVGQDFIFLQ